MTHWLQVRKIDVVKNVSELSLERIVANYTKEGSFTQSHVPLIVIRFSSFGDHDIKLDLDWSS